MKEDFDYSNYGYEFDPDRFDKKQPSKCWRIMPFRRPHGDEWWVLGPDNRTVPGGVVSTREEAFSMALSYNKHHDINAVFVYDACGKNGRWEEEPESGVVLYGHREMTTEQPVNILHDGREMTTKEEKESSKPSKQNRNPINKRKILTVVAMVAFVAIITLHYYWPVYFYSYYHYDYRQVLKFEPGHFGNLPLIKDVRMPLFVLAVFYAGMFFILGEGKPH
jgi:hypothetical protein